MCHWSFLIKVETLLVLRTHSDPHSCLRDAGIASGDLAAIQIRVSRFPGTLNGQEEGVGIQVTRCAPADTLEGGRVPGSVGQRWASRLTTLAGRRGAWSRPVGWAHYRWRMVKVPAPQSAFLDSAQQEGELEVEASLQLESGSPGSHRHRHIFFHGVGQLASEGFVSCRTALSLVLDLERVSVSPPHRPPQVASTYTPLIWGVGKNMCEHQGPRHLSLQILG